MPWHTIVGTHNRVVHSYWEIDAQVLWDIVTVEIPQLLPQIRAILATM